MDTSIPLITAPAGIAGRLNAHANWLFPPAVVAYTLLDDNAFAGLVQPVQDAGLCKPVSAARTGAGVAALNTNRTTKIAAKNCKYNFFGAKIKVFIFPHKS